jgi:murein DD-endopeptidase MepM/ murein hydrolase activator NlpD
MSASNTFDVQLAVDRVSREAAKDPSPERLKALTTEFESMLVGQMLKQLRTSMFTDGEGKEDAGTAPLSDALFAELSLAITRAGGLGLSEAVMAPLARQSGLASETPAPAALPLAMPALAGRMSSAYGWRRDPIDDSLKFHKGMDIALPVGQDVPTPQAGTVTFAGEQPGYGLTVVVDHGQDLSTRYAHLSSIDVKAGDVVGAGEVIAKSGASGRATGAHLHFEVTQSGKTVNPSEILATYAASRPQ